LAYNKTMSKQAITSDKSLPFSEVVIANGMAYVSGQIGFNREGELVDGGIEAQTRATFENLKTVLAKANLGLEDVVRSGCYLVNREDLTTFNKIYAEYFTSDKPARSTVFVAGLPIKRSIVEIDVVAAV
jgi:2-iminobutanoate/2-iminopropanoate deaminase